MLFLPQKHLLSERYEILRRIGAGGMGTVYLANDRKTSLPVAVKVLNFRGTFDKGEIRFRREFRAISRCSHPHVVRVLDFGADQDLLYLVMDFIDGTDLRNALIEPLLQNGVAAFDQEKYSRIFMQVCDALDFIHSQRIIHRDIKPENILIDSEGQVKVMDFGLSRLQDPGSYVTQTGEIMGTAAYLSPEQGQGGQMDYRTDIYSLGVCMFEAATGELPFQGTNPIALVFQHIQQKPRPPRKLNSLIPPALDSLIIQMLEKDPLNRPQRAYEIHEALAAIAASPNVILDLRTQPLVRVDTVTQPQPDFLFDPVFVNRKEELNLLNDKLIEVKNDRGSVVLIEGEAGIGKTRLIREMQRSLRRLARKEMLVMVGGICNEKAGGQPYEPFVSCFRELIRQRKPVLDSAAVEELRLWGPDFMRLVPEIVQWLPDETPPLHKTDGNPTEPDQQKVRQNLYGSVVSFLKTITTQQPLILFIDNLHWADQATLELFRFLMAETVHLPLLLIGAFRPSKLMREFDRKSVSTKRSSGSFSAPRLKLRQFTRSDLVRMVQSMLGTSQPPDDDFFDNIFRITGGNPYFIQEFMRVSLEEKELFLRDGQWKLHPGIADFKVLSGSLREMVLRRVDRLSSVGMAILDYAVAFDNEIDIEHLHQLLDYSPEQVTEHVDVLVNAGILVEGHRHDVETYVFQHPTVREAIYSRLADEKRREIHGRIARFLETIFADNLDEHCQQLAYHYESSGDLGKALFYLLQAVVKSEELFAYETALEYLHKARKLIAFMPESAIKDEHLSKIPSYQKLIREIARMHIFLGDFETAVTTLDEGLRISDERADLNERLELLNLKGMLYYRLSDYIRALEFWQEAVNLAAGLEAWQTQAITLDNIGQVCWSLGQYIEALDYVKQALEVNHRFGWTDAEALNLQHLGKLEETLDNMDAAVEKFQQSLELRFKLGNVASIAESFNSLGSIYAAKGHYRKAEEYHHKAAVMVESLSVHELRTQIIIGHIFDVLALGRYDEASHMLNSLRVTQQQGDILLTIDTLRIRALLSMYLMSLRDAERFAREAFDLAKKSGNRNPEATLRWLLGVIALKQGDYGQALEQVNTAEELARLSGDRKSLVQAMTLQLILAYELFHTDRVTALSTEIIDLAGRTGNTLGSFIAHLIRSNSALRQKDIELATTEFGIAENQFTDIQAADYRWRLMKLKSKLFFAKGRLQEAVTTMSEAVEFIEKTAKNIADVDDRRNYLTESGKIGMYSFLISLLIDSGKSEDAIRHLLSAPSEDVQNLLYDRVRKSWKGENISAILTFESSGLL